MPVQIVHGNLLNQDVDAIVNPWNRNFIPWWLLLPQGVSGQIKKAAGRGPFRELAKVGPMKTGQAVETSAGTLSYQWILHVAALEWYWVATDRSIRQSAINALELAKKLNIRSLAFPLIGAGTGGKQQERSMELIRAACEQHASDLEVTIVRYQKAAGE
tara:strand:+ start:114700 stop:115176 length:477 start_codon:yes stop_codon:yes gene_type:complete